MFLPITGNDAVPLVFNFHGYTSNATEQMWYGDFRPIADTAGFIIVHPEGTLDNTNMTHFNVGFGGSTVDDVSFSGALLDTLIASYNINAARVYSTGMSNGGYMSFYLACQMSDRIAAIASITGSMSPLIYNTCNPQHPTPILQMHGTADATVPYVGNAWSESIVDVLDYWVNYNNCNPVSSLYSFPDINTGDGSTVDLIKHDDGDNCSSVVHYKVNGGPHSWPGALFGTTNQDIKGSTEIWNFFRQYDINGCIGSVGIDEIEEDALSIYPVPANDYIVVEGYTGSIEDLTLLDLLGKDLRDVVGIEEGQVSNSVSIDLTLLPDGVYFVKTGNGVHKITKN